MRKNSFDAIRLCAAVTVLLAHSFPLSGAVGPTIGNENPASLAVLVFFAISGYLITASWQREPHLLRYLAKRMLRIYPALLVVVALMVLVLGPLVTTAPLGTYFGSHETWNFAGMNALAFHNEQYLPGVFAHTPYVGQVNGSIWTLVGELLAYVAVALVGCLGLFRRRAVGFVSIAVAMYLMQRLPSNVFYVVPWWTWVFAAGSGLYLFHDRVPWKPWLAVGLPVAYVASIGHRPEPWMAVLAASYCPIYVAHRFPNLLRPITRRGDFSYAIYLYAFPIQQTVAWALGRSVNPWVMMAIALPATCALAVLSWFAVERPMLALKKRRAERRPALQPTAATA